MIKELSELGKKLREQNAGEKINHDAIKEEPISIDLIIKKDGSFYKFEPIEKIVRPAEAITAKKGKARLLLDKAEEVLGYDGEEKKHKLFLDKLKEYEHVAVLKPVFDFYTVNKINGIAKALDAFENQVNEKERTGNIAFRVVNDDCRLHEKKEIYEAIIANYNQRQRDKISAGSRKCSICGKNDYPVEDTPHGMIMRVPDGQPMGCALVSYNDDAYESYGLQGNLNSSICTNCARTYVESLNWMLKSSTTQTIEDKKGKLKEKVKFTNRRNFGTDTAIVYWTRDNQKVSDLDLFDNPDPGTVAHLIESVASGEVKKSKHIDSDWFYSCTLSGAAARIAVRDWIEMSLVDLKKAIARWFEDIKIEAWGELYYPPLYRLSNCAQNEKSDNKTTSARIATYLWKSSLKETAPPLWILTAILKRVRIIENTEDGGNKEGITPDRAALIRFIINRNNKGGSMLNEQLDTENCSPPYICGRIFAVLESIQRAALGKDINAGIRERFYTFASTNPSSAFGRLMKLTQNHLTKLKNEKAGLAVILDRELQGLFSKIQKFPAIFALEEQGQFAIGYYHQKQDTWKKANSNAELKAATEESEKATED
ncbi:MAG TPA: type I-C CRISPR-associated protein Cas8c/Csd1 [Spirochaetota bacterium]|nr:type I-C CRISPR-associated protein Cas8c/Csd1 [Spirochaetota bacterium]